MSHLTTIETKLKSAEVVKIALRNLGLTVLENVKSVKHYYANERGEKMLTGCAYAIETGGEYKLGVIEDPETKMVSFGGDFWGIDDCSGNQGFQVLETLGYEKSPKTGKHYDELTRDGVWGHVGTKVRADLNPLQQEYNLVAAELQFTYEGRQMQRVAGPDEGDTTLLVWGGGWPQGATVRVISKRDGSVIVSGHEFTGPTDCKHATDAIEQMLGTVTDTVPVANYCHATVGGRQVHVQH